MDDLIIRSASARDLEEARHWLNKDSGITDALTAGNPNRAPIDLTNAEDCWAAELQGELVALASFSEDRERRAHIGFIVNPARRREGIAKAFIPRLLEHQDIKRFAKVVCTPALSNTAALKILRRAGFYQTGYDDNGLVVFERR